MKEGGGRYRHRRSGERYRHGRMGKRNSRSFSVIRQYRSLSPMNMSTMSTMHSKEASKARVALEFWVVGKMLLAPCLQFSNGPCLIQSKGSGNIFKIVLAYI